MVVVTFIDCLKLIACDILLSCVRLLLRVLCLLVIQCGCHWSQLKATYLLIYLLTYLRNRLPCRTLPDGQNRKSRTLWR